jgi:hypothetical protein
MVSIRYVSTRHDIGQGPFLQSDLKGRAQLHAMRREVAGERVRLMRHAGGPSDTIGDSEPGREGEGQRPDSVNPCRCNG